MAPSIAQAAISLLFIGSVWATSNSDAQGGVLVKRVEAPEVLPGTWKYQGCYQDGAPRTLSGPQYASGDAMTGASCIDFCETRGYAFAGTEYSQECFCGNAIPTNRPVTPVADCNMGCTGNTTEACGGPDRLSIYWNGQADTPGPSHNPGDLGFGFMGCYTEGTINNGRALTHAGIFTGGLTIKKCIQACITQGWSMAGAEYANECYCGNEFENLPELAPGGLSDCSQTCLGNNTEFCGAGNRLNVYKLGYVGVTSTTTTTTVSTTTSAAVSTTTVAPTTTVTTSAVVSTTNIASTTTTATSATSTAAQVLSHKPTIGAYTRLGCYTDTVAQRALQGPQADFAGQTLDKCSAVCAGSSYFGVEYGGECFCGNTLGATSTKAADSDCSFICPGNQYQYCGAGDRLELYKLSSLVSTTAASSSTTTTSPISSSVIVSRSNSISSSIIVSSSTTTSVAPTTTITTSSAVPTTTTTTTTSAVPTQSGLPDGWKYSGCYTEGTAGRALINQQPGGPTNTIDTCIARCISLGFTVAGLEWSEQCFCDKFVRNGAVPAPEARCNMPCSGNDAQKCGAGDILSVYNIGELKVYSAPAAQKTDLPGSWEYDGCWTDSAITGRVLKWQIASQNNSATSCLSRCSTYGFMSGGMEYGEECYCGDHDAMLAQGSIKQPDSECATPCTGDPTFICGGGNRLSYYRWTGTPLYEWAKPTGNNAGSYQFLVGGVVIPLITTLGINDKVVFMEKSGTGAPNTTGTYELDLNHLDDMSKAWRSLHVKTDIFCAAGVTLPDKAGRQLNVGGWSGRSTYGVRLYTPDGFNGAPGVNDWQEDESKLSLLDGRWYPSAINLANGSVLVVGGEQGSNAAATPTVEILPLPVGGYSKYMDWLQRTDPDNLYPFMWVLPSGGIFIMYYNEGRILDERTLDTTKLLPLIPGSVNNAGSGRTYPLEGTAVMLPLHSPFDQPATILVCGGSSNFAGQAIDNCVSVQPSIAAPAYTIERMPTPRVMSCMCALPDGTFLILNGALQGVAGFGLATGPNLQAVLYDPTKAVGHRMSIMASTIVARMYHSEAILLPDGRVLVSGSNPEDGKNPEEYRVEVFSPPYALNGQIPPIYTLNKKDWAYADAGSIQITTTIPSGNLAAVRVSMMAAVSSTHGNSMGQRTLFLNVACSGGAGSATCTVTSPPSAHVAPPGWYQIFLLDGARPGKGLWVRVGGAIADAAGIGNWPNIPGWVVPGLGPVE